MRFYPASTQLVPVALLALIFWGQTGLAWAQSEPSPPWIKEPGQKVFREKYTAGAPGRAFAIAESGQYGWIDKRDSPGKAAQMALFNCVRQAPTAPCLLYSVNGNGVIDLYAIAASDTSAVLARMPPPRQKVTADEARETGLEPTYDPRKGSLEGPTPLSSPYALTVTTGALAEMLSSKDRPVVLDVTEPRREYKKAAIPGAVWIGGAGIYDEKINAQTDRYLSRVMSHITSNKEGPVVVYCGDWKCWEAYNAMQRLYTLGYRKLFWYRGGFASWSKAGLPGIEVPLSAQVSAIK